MTYVVELRKRYQKRDLINCGRLTIQTLKPEKRSFARKYISKLVGRFTMSLDDYNAWMESCYLLSNPVNAAHLRESLKQANEGDLINVTLDEL